MIRTFTAAISLRANAILQAGRLRTRAQYTWVSGCHSLIDETMSHLDLITKTRSAIMRCLLRRGHYISNPNMYFALLTSPSLNPFFARVADGLQAARRPMQDQPLAHAIRTKFEQIHAPAFDGPATFLRQANTPPGFEGCVELLFQEGFEHPSQWMHKVRERWRSEQFKKVAVNPDFDGLQTAQRASWESSKTSSAHRQRYRVSFQ